MTKQTTKSTRRKDAVVIELTAAQAAFLHALLAGFIDREAGGEMGTAAIIRKVSQIGKRLSDAAGFDWRHKSR